MTHGETFDSRGSIVASVSSAPERLSGCRTGPGSGVCETELGDLPNASRADVASIRGQILICVRFFAGVFDPSRRPSH